MALNFLNNGYFAGKVGIGTPSPSYQLTLGGNAAGSTEGLRINDPSNAAYGAHFSFSDTPNEVWIGGITNNTYNSAIGIHREATRAITIDVNSNVGIGTTSPFTIGGTAKLSVYASGPSTFGLSSSDAVYLRRYGVGQYQFQTTANSGNTGDLSLQSYGGNVGIGTTNPLGKLQVNEYTVASQGNQNVHGEVSVFANNGDESLFLGLKDSAYPNRGWAFNPVANGVNSDLQIKEHGSSGVRMTMQSNGNVGIGTTSPTAKLHVTGTGLFTGLVSGITPVAAANFVTKAYADAGNARVTPATPSTITSTIVGETIEIAFNQSSTSNIDYYQVWSSDDGGDYGIIAQITPADFSSTMTVVDTTFVTGGTMSYRVFAVREGIYSTAGTTSKAYTVSALSVTDMTVVNLNTAYYIQYEKPTSRFIDHVEIYMDSQTTSAALSRSNATIVYSGQNASYMRNVNTSSNFHQFWVEIVTS